MPKKKSSKSKRASASSTLHHRDHSHDHGQDGDVKSLETAVLDLPKVEDSAVAENTHLEKALSLLRQLNDDTFDAISAEILDETRGFSPEHRVSFVEEMLKETLENGMAASVSPRLCAQLRATSLATYNWLRKILLEGCERYWHAFLQFLQTADGMTRPEIVPRVRNAKALMRLVGHLYCKDVMGDMIFTRYIVQPLKASSSEYGLECLCNLLAISGGKLATENAKVFQQLVQDLGKRQNLPHSLQYKLLDTITTGQNRWDKDAEAPQNVTAPLLAAVVDSRVLLVSHACKHQLSGKLLPLALDCGITSALGYAGPAAVPEPMCAVVVTGLRNAQDTSYVTTLRLIGDRYKGVGCDKEGCQRRVLCDFHHNDDVIPAGQWRLCQQDEVALLQMKLSILEFDAQFEGVLQAVKDSALRTTRETIGTVLALPKEHATFGLIQPDDGIHPVAFARQHSASGLSRSDKVVFGAVDPLQFSGSTLHFAVHVSKYDPAQFDRFMGPEHDHPDDHWRGRDPTSKKLFGSVLDGGRDVTLDVSEPFCLVAVGVQGAGKSHTMRVVLENCTMTPPGGEPQWPMAALVCHFDHFARGPSDFANIARAADADAGAEAPIVHVFTTPNNHVSRRRVYHTLGGRVRVAPLKFAWCSLSDSQIRALMKIRRDDDPLYMSVVSKVLRRGRRTFAEFRDAVGKEEFREQQRVGLMQRLDALASFLAIAGESVIPLENCVAAGSVVLVDLSDPNLSETDANAVFQVVFERFHQTNPTVGKLAVFDEAHKYLTERDDLSKSIVDAVRQQRHWGVRVAISTQSPEVLCDEILDLVSAAVLHRFHSPAWFRRLSARLPLDADEFDRICELDVGCGVLFASGHLFSEAGSMTSSVVRTRELWTAPGGRTLRHDF